MADTQGATDALNVPAAPPNIGGFGSALAALNQNTQQLAATAQQNRQRMSGAMKGMQTEMAKPMPTFPNLQPMPPAPQAQSDLQQTGAAFFALSTALVSIMAARGRRHATDALIAFGASLRGLHQGNLEQFKEKQAEWKDKAEAAIQENQQLIDKYTAAMSNRKESIDEIAHNVAMTAAENQDNMMYVTAIGRNTSMMADIVERRNEFNANYALQVKKMNQNYEDQRAAIGDYLKAGGFDITTKEGQNKFALFSLMHPNSAKALEGAMKIGLNATPIELSDAQLNFHADMWLKTGQMMLTGMGAKVNEAKLKIIARAADRAEAEGMSVGDVIAVRANLHANQQGLNTLTRIQSLSNTYQDTALKSIDIIRDLAAKGVGPTGIPFFDAWVQAGRLETGDPDVQALLNAMGAYEAEYAKVMGGGTGAQPATDLMQKKAEKMINTAQNMEMLDKALVTMTKEMNGRKRALNTNRQHLLDAIKEGGGAITPEVSTPTTRGFEGSEDEFEGFSVK